MNWTVVPREIGELKGAPRRTIIGIALAACLVRLFFWSYTGRIWEDALITVLHSENAGSGLGLTHHHPGYPPLHGFTSPLSVLIPLMADLFHPGWGLPWLKLVSALIAIPTVLLAAAIALNRAFRVNIWLVFLLCGYVAFEHHQILWGMAGMETQVAVFTVFLTLYHALKLNGRALAVSMALCMYARPDFAILLMFVAAYLFVAARRMLLKTGLTAAALYAPWMVFTTLYYGSPVPNTIIAKGLGYHLWWNGLPLFSVRLFNGAWARIYDHIFLPLGPSFAGHGSGFLKFMDEGLIARATALLLIVGMLAMLRKFRPFYIIPLGSLLAYSFYYVFLVQGMFGWYLAPFSAVNCLALVLGLALLLERYAIPDRIPSLSRFACVAYIVPFLVVLPITFGAERDIQRYIETPVRMAIGRYLFEHKQPGDRIGCEPLGFIGYYSRMPVLDYPGLASPEVTAFLKANPDRRVFHSVLEHFRPEWMALRENEYRYMLTLSNMKFLETEYSVERVFRSDPWQTPKIHRVAHNIDLTFYLLKKKRR